MYQELSNGMLGFYNCLKIADVPFPLPYAQLLGLLLIAFSCLIPFYAAWMQDPRSKSQIGVSPAMVTWWWKCFNGQLTLKTLVDPNFSQTVFNVSSTQVACHEPACFEENPTFSFSQCCSTWMLRRLSDLRVLWLILLPCLLKVRSAREHRFRMGQSFW